MKSLTRKYVLRKYSPNMRLPRLSPVVSPDGAAEYEPNELAGVTFLVKPIWCFLSSSSSLIKVGVASNGNG